MASWEVRVPEPSVPPKPRLWMLMLALGGSFGLLWGSLAFLCGR